MNNISFSMDECVMILKDQRIMLLSLILIIKEQHAIKAPCLVKKNQL